MRILFIFSLLFIVNTTYAETAKCTESLSEAAENSIDSMKTWEAIHTGFKKYHLCDDGSIAEGFTDAIVHQLASNWNLLPKVALLTKNDPKFRTFFLKHINTTADTNELYQIKKLSKSHCATNIQSLCSSIQQSVIQAIGEQTNP